MSQSILRVAHGSVDHEYGEPCDVCIKVIKENPYFKQAIHDYILQDIIGYDDPDEMTAVFNEWPVIVDHRSRNKLRASQRERLEKDLEK